MKQDLEAFIRAGRIREAEQGLRKINFEKIPREEALSFANIARRVQRFDLALRILNPIVHSKRELDTPATPPEKIEYAQSLRKLGALREAIDILELIDAEQFPEAHLHLAFCHFAEWNSQAAVTRLHHYLQDESVTPYGRLVAKVNLAGALATKEDHLEAIDLLRELLPATSSDEHRLLHANCLELMAQIHILFKHEWDAGLDCLTEARKYVDMESHGVSVLFIKKWESVAQSMRANRVSPYLIDVQEQARQLGHWETVRDCDFHIARLNQDKPTLHKLYFGTPYESFRQRVLGELDLSEIPPFYVWSGDPQETKQIFDLRFAALDDGKVFLEPGQSLHKLMIALTRDFYKPLPLLALFSQLFPGEHYSPTHSPNRIHQLMRRLRKFLTQNQLHTHLILSEDKGSYGLQPRGDLGLRKPRKHLALTSRELELHFLQSKLKCDLFTTQEATSATGNSRQTVQRLLQWALETNKAQIIHDGRMVRYKITA